MQIDLSRFTREERLEIEENLVNHKWDERLGKEPSENRKARKKGLCTDIMRAVYNRNARDYGRKINLPYGLESRNGQSEYHTQSHGSEYVFDEATVKTVLLIGISKDAPCELVEAFEQAAELWRKEQDHYKRKVRIANTKVNTEMTSIETE